MSIDEYFYNLPNELKDKFASTLYELGLMIELNKAQYNAHLKRLANSTATPLKLRKMYKFMLKLDWNDRHRFFDAFYTQ